MCIYEVLTLIIRGAISSGIKGPDVKLEDKGLEPKPQISVALLKRHTGVTDTSVRADSENNTLPFVLLVRAKKKKTIYIERKICHPIHSINT